VFALGRKKWHVLRNRDVSHQRRTCMHAFKLESRQPGGGINNHGETKDCRRRQGVLLPRTHVLGCEIMQPDDDMQSDEIIRRLH
jgi:hypothetical protein